MFVFVLVFLFLFFKVILLLDLLRGIHGADFCKYFPSAYKSHCVCYPLQGRTSQCVAVCCSVLQCNAVCCSMLQRVTECQATAFAILSKVEFLSVLKCVAVCDSVLHCVAVCCSVLQCVAVC